MYACPSLQSVRYGACGQWSSTRRPPTGSTRVNTFSVSRQRLQQKRAGQLLFVEGHRPAGMVNRDRLAGQKIPRREVPAVKTHFGRSTCASASDPTANPGCSPKETCVLRSGSWLSKRNRTRHTPSASSEYVNASATRIRIFLRLVAGRQHRVRQRGATVGHDVHLRFGERLVPQETVRTADDLVPTVGGVPVQDAVQVVPHDGGMVAPAIGVLGKIAVAPEEAGPAAAGTSPGEADGLRPETRHDQAGARVRVGQHIDHFAVAFADFIRTAHGKIIPARLRASKLDS